MSLNRRSFCGILTLAASLGLLGCGSTTGSYVRAVNASNGLSNYTIQVGQTGIASSLPYGSEGVQPKGQYVTNDNSGNYRLIPDGTSQTVSVYQTPGSKPLATANQTFVKNSYYTVATIGPAPGIALRILTDGDTTPASGDYKLRLIDASPTAGGVDVYVTPAGGSIAGTQPQLINFQFGQVAPAYLQLSASLSEVQIARTGTASVFFTGTFTPTAGDVYSGFFLDPQAPASSPYGLLLVKDPVQ